MKDESALHAEAPEPADPIAPVKKSTLANAIASLKERLAGEKISVVGSVRGAFGSGRKHNHIRGWKKSK